MYELWLSFLGAFIRFWDNRFKQSSCYACEILKEENARLRAENSKLMDLVLAPVSPAVETTGEVNFEPIRTTPSWTAIKRGLETKHRKIVESYKETAGLDKTAELEKDLAELEKA